VVLGDGTEVWGKIHMNRGRVGEERRGQETDGCPLTDTGRWHSTFGKLLTLEEEQGGRA
jgi:hypothetical protein